MIEEEFTYLVECPCNIELLLIYSGSYRTLQNRSDFRKIATWIRIKRGWHFVSCFPANWLKNPDTEDILLLYRKDYRHWYLRRNELVGYGFSHLPSSPGLHNIKILTWRPTGDNNDTFETRGKRINQELAFSSCMIRDIIREIWNIHKCNIANMHHIILYLYSIYHQI